MKQTQGYTEKQKALFRKKLKKFMSYEVPAEIRKQEIAGLDAEIKDTKKFYARHKYKKKSPYQPARGNIKKNTGKKIGIKSGNISAPTGT